MLFILAVCIEHQASFVQGWVKMDRYVHCCAQKHSMALREKSQGIVSLELCQPSWCWSVIIFEKGLWGPIKLFPVRDSWDQRAVTLPSTCYWLLHAATYRAM